MPVDIAGGSRSIATDVDEEALAAARAGAYSERDMRGLPDEYRERYFDTEVISGVRVKARNPAQCDLRTK